MKTPLVVLLHITNDAFDQTVILSILMLNNSETSRWNFDCNTLTVSEKLSDLKFVFKRVGCRSENPSQRRHGIPYKCCENPRVRMRRLQPRFKIKIRNIYIAYTRIII